MIAALRKDLQILSLFWSVFGLYMEKYEPEKTPFLDTFYGV